MNKNALDALIDKTDWPLLETGPIPFPAALGRLLEEVLRCQSLEVFLRYLRTVADRLEPLADAGLLQRIAPIPGGMPPVPDEPDYAVPGGLLVHGWPVDSLRRSHGLALGVNLHTPVDVEQVHARLASVVSAPFDAATVQAGMKAYGATLPIREMEKQSPEQFYMLATVATPDGGTHIMCYPWADEGWR